MRVHEQEKRAQQAELRAKEVLQASYRQMRKAERNAKETRHRAEELKWRIDGRGIRPRRPAKRLERSPSPSRSAIRNTPCPVSHSSVYISASEPAWVTTWPRQAKTSPA